MPTYKYQTKSGELWYAKLNYIDPITQKSTQKVKRGFKTQREAKRYESQFMANLEKTTDDPTVGPKAPFPAVYADYRRHIECVELAPDTIITKTNMINRYILPYFNKYAIGEISEDVLREWKADMLSRTNNHGNPLSQTYLRSIQNQLNAILNYAVKKRYINVSPMLDLKKLGSKYAEEKEIWTPEEFDRFADAAMKRPETYYLYLIYFWCGLRRGEGLSLTVGDIHFEENGVNFISVLKSTNSRKVVGDTKNKSSVRQICIPDFLANELREYIATLYDPQPADKLFDITTKTMYDNFYAACKEAGVKRIRIHDLRHSYASLLINSRRYSSTDIAHQLGHSSANITLRTYSHMFEPTKLDVAKTLENIKKGV